MKIPFSTSEHILVCNEIVKVPHPLYPMSVRFAWLDGETGERCQRKGVLARYNALFNRIEIPAYLKNAVVNDNKMLPTLVHELTHANQRRYFGLLTYAVLAFPLWRELTLEPLAESWEALARNELRLEHYETGED